MKSIGSPVVSDLPSLRWAPLLSNPHAPTLASELPSLSEYDEATPPQEKTPAHAAVYALAPSRNLVVRLLPRWTEAQYSAFGEALQRYLEQEQDLIPRHAAWHQVNGPGGTRGEGSGIAFLTMHRRMVRDLEGWLIRAGCPGLSPLGNWTPAQPIPPALGVFERYSNDPKLDTPSWLSLRGGEEADPLFGAKKLQDFRSPDQLGRAMGSGRPANLGYHGAGHAKIGGLMWSGRAPVDPIFWLWHKHLDAILDRWFTTSKGREWLASDPGRQWTMALAEPPHMSPELRSRIQALLDLRVRDPQRYRLALDESPFSVASKSEHSPSDALPIQVLQLQNFPALEIQIQTLALDLHSPRDLVFGSEGGVFFREHGGRMRRLEDGVVRDVSSFSQPTEPEEPAPEADIEGLCGCAAGVLFPDVYGSIAEARRGPDDYVYLFTNNRNGQGSPGPGDDKLLRIVPLEKL